MARKRMIDPSIWSDEKLGLLSPLHRLLFIGLFSNADDEGRLPGHPNYIKSIIFPYDNDITPHNVEAMLRDLNNKGLILIYVVNEQRYIQVVNFLKYQKINRPTPSKIPPPPAETTVKNATSCFNESSLNIHGVFNESSLNIHEQFSDQIEKEIENNKNTKSEITNVISPRTGSDEPTCVQEQNRSTISNHPNHLDSEKNEEQSDPVEIPENQDTAKTKEPLITTGEEPEEKSKETGESGVQTAELPAPGEPLTAGEELDEIELLLSDAGTSAQKQQNRLNSAEFEEIDEQLLEELLEEFFKNEETGENPGTVETDERPVAAGEVKKGKPSLIAAASRPSETVIHGTTAVLEQEDTRKHGIKQQVENTLQTSCQEEPEEEPSQNINNRRLIAILTAKFHEIIGEEMKLKSDYPYIGGLYNEFGYFIVENALGTLARKMKKKKLPDNETCRRYLAKVCLNLKKTIHNPTVEKKQLSCHQRKIVVPDELLKLVNSTGRG